MSKGALRFNDTISGMHSGEHAGHDEPHPPGPVRGVVSQGSLNVIINGKLASRKDDVTDESDSCCGLSHGNVGSGSSTVLINGKPAARQKDKLNQHSGSGQFTSSSNNVLIGD